MTAKAKLYTGEPDSGREYPIARSLKEGADYSPKWRAMVTETFIRQITQAKDQEAAAAEVLRRERDGFIRELVQFHRGVSFPNQLSVQRATRLGSVAQEIKAMVIAGQSMQAIAKLVSTQTETIEYFEKLFFDARRYLDEELWIHKQCYGESGNRLMRVALRRGSAGLLEVMLRAGPKSPRNLQRSTSVLHGRLEDYVFELETNNVPVGEKDFERFIRACQLSASGKLPFLDDPPPAEKDEKPYSPTLRKLGPVGNERLRQFFEPLLAAAANKSAALEADKEKDIAPNCSKKQDGQTVKEQPNGAK